MARKKCRETDLTIDSLPHTRRELFFDIFSQRWKLIIVLGMFIVLGMLPILLTFLLKDISLETLYRSYDWSTISDTQRYEYEAIAREQNNFWNLFLLPSFIVFALILSGVYRVIRQLNYGKGIHFFDDFKIGIKQNFLQFFIISIIAFIITYLCSMIANSDIDNVFVRYFPLGLSLIVFVPLFLNMLSLSVTYNYKFGSLMKTALIFSFRNILWYLLFIVALFIPLTIFFIPQYFIAYGIFIVVSLIYYPLFILANYLFNFATFDKYINKEQYPEHYRKGLY